MTHCPSRRGVRGVGAMDLCLAEPDGAITVDVFAARCVAELVSDRLAQTVGWSVWSPTELPAWTDAAGRTADDVAIDLVERRLQPDELREDADSDH